jgi:hypothetical protein
MRFILTTFETLTDTFGELIVGIGTTAICLAFALTAWHYIVRVHEGPKPARPAAEKRAVAD